MENLSLEDIASYCEFHDCSATVLSPEVGAIRVDGTGYLRNGYTYGRFHLLSEFQTANPEEVVAKASSFRFRRGEDSWEWSREEFAKALATFRQKLGI